MKDKGPQLLGITEDLLDSLGRDQKVVSRRAPKPKPIRKVVRTSDRYSHILEPFKLNDKYTMRNRVMCSPMVFGAAVVGNQYGNAAYAPAKYQKLEGPAAGGSAIVSVGEIDVNSFESKRMPLPDVDFSLRSGEAFNAISEYAWRIKRHGAIALHELCHSGFTKPSIPGTEIWGPVAGTSRDGGTILPIDEEMMDSICNDFVSVALYMQAAGFDGVCIHAGHGFLFTQFLSPLINTRTDEYGGKSLENRARFPLRILREIREAVGKDFIIEMRISGYDGIPGGIVIEETTEFIRMCEGIITSVHISCGMYGGTSIKSGGIRPIFCEHGFNLDYAAYVKQRVSMPVGVVGYLTDPDMIENALAEGKCDYVVIGRQMIADPEYVNKLAEGREKEIRKCIGCVSCFEFPDPEQEVPFDGIMPWLKAGSCAINPMANSKKTWDELPQPAASRKVVIVGGGPAGMQAAVTAADRGHQVVLFEEKDVLGGTLFFTEVDVDKKDICELKDTMIYEISLRSNIQVKTGVKATAELIRAEEPDAVILAIGAHEKKIPIPGIEHAIPALDVFREGTVIGDKVVMVGGGLVGAETGLHLAHTGHQVTVVEMIKRIAHESCGIYRRGLMEALDDAKVQCYVKTKCKEIRPDGVVIEQEDGSESFLAADTVIYALGMEPNDVSDLENAVPGAAVYKIGDCSKVGKIGNATRTGFDAAVAIL